MKGESANPPRLLSVAEVAEATGLSETAVYRAIAAGELRASKLRGRLRVRLADLEDWVEANVVQAEALRHTRSGLDRPRPRSRERGLRELLCHET